VFALLVFVIQGCNLSTANMSSFKTSSDKAGTTETTSFKAGDPIYARADIANNPGKVKVKFTMIPEGDYDEMKKGESIKELEVNQDLDGDGVATYTVTTPSNFPDGSYKINADMINEAGEKKDGKSVTVKIEGE